MRMITGAWVAQAVYVAAQLGIADVIATEGPRSPGDLAERVDADPDALYRVLRALAGVGVFTERADGTFALTPLAESLRSDVPGSLRAFAIMMGGEGVWRSWGEVLHTVRTGEPAFDHVFGMPVFDYYAANPAAARVGAAGLSARSAGENAAIVAAYDFSAADCVMDVGGGEGSLLRAILAAHPQLRGVLFEMPHVVDLARAALVGAPEIDRCELVAGDFFTAIPRRELAASPQEGHPRLDRRARSDDLAQLPGRAPRRGTVAAGGERRPPGQRALVRQVARSADAGLRRGARTDCGRVPRPARHLRIRDEAGGPHGGERFRHRSRRHVGQPHSGEYWFEPATSSPRSNPTEVRSAYWSRSKAVRPPPRRATCGPVVTQLVTRRPSLLARWDERYASVGRRERR